MKPRRLAPLVALLGLYLCAVPPPAQAQSLELPSVADQVYGMPGDRL